MFKIFNPFFWIKIVLIGFIAVAGISYVGINLATSDSTFRETMIDNLDAVAEAAEAMEKASTKRKNKAMSEFKAMQDTTIVPELHHQHRINTIEFAK